MARHLVRYGIPAIFILLVLYHLNPSNWTNILNQSNQRETIKSKLVFPASFPVDASKLHTLVKENTFLTRNGYHHYHPIRKHRQRPQTISKDDFLPHNFQAYDSSQDIDLDLTQCGALQRNISAEVSEAIELPVPPCDIVSHIIEQIDRGEEYMTEFAPYFSKQIRLQVKHKVCDRFWFRLAGSSVFLKEYGYHLLISRLAYSPEGKRQDPKFSFAYAQLYDQNWKEAKDISLIVPSNDEGGEVFISGQAFRVVHYPQIVAVPIHHNYKQVETKYLGPEDPRLLLVKNKKGYEEPVMVFNLAHQKYQFADDDEDEFLLKKPTQFRALWVSYPWQVQKGKRNVDDRLKSPFANSTYTKSFELRIKNLPRQEKQKNWTPMISEVDREKDGYDKTLLFVYRWASLEILKCDMDTGLCGFVYQRNENLRASSSVGPFRGGTPMANIRHVLSAQQYDLTHFQKLIPPNREIWLGFARAHLVKCGCGHDLYRPNLVVLVKDTIQVDGSPKDVYKLNDVSSFASLYFEIVPWNPQKPFQLCSGTNALIPNGISDWQFEVGEDDQVDVSEITDELTLTLSSSDITVHKIMIRGLFKALIQDSSLFLPSEGNVDEKKLMVPSEKEYKSGAVTGYNNDNLVCAMLASVKFCSDYGKIKIESERYHILDTILLADDGPEIMLDGYHDNLNELGLDLI